jgi:hypothetical protein
VSTVHVHPWHLIGLVIAGRITNVCYTLGAVDYDAYRVSAMRRTTITTESSAAKAAARSG